MMIIKCLTGTIESRKTITIRTGFQLNYLILEYLISTRCEQIESLIFQEEFRPWINSKRIYFCWNVVGIIISGIKNVHNGID